MSDFASAVGETKTDDSAAPAATKTPEPQVQVLENGNIAVGGRVYAPEAAATKIVHADQHIQTLETENAEKDAQLVELLDRVKSMEAKMDHGKSVEQLAEQLARPELPSPTEEVSKDEIVAAAVSAIDARNLEEKRKANLTALVAEAKSAYGEAFSDKIDELAAAKGITPEDAVLMAKDQPAVFRSLFIPEKNTTTAPDTTSSTVGGNAGELEPAPVKRKSFTRMSSKQRSEYIAAKMAELASSAT